MAKKLAIDLDPKGPIYFNRSIKIPTGDGKPLTVDFDFLFRDRIEMAELLQKWDTQVEQSRAEAKSAVDAAGAAETQVNAPRPDLVAATNEGIDADVETLMDFVTGWNLVSDFNRENLAKFVRKYPGAPLALVRDYREGMTQGRLGN
jgi:hypothetical protein